MNTEVLLNFPPQASIDSLKNSRSEDSTSVDSAFCDRPISSDNSCSHVKGLVSNDSSLITTPSSSQPSPGSGSGSALSDINQQYCEINTTEFTNPTNDNTKFPLLGQEDLSKDFMNYMPPPLYQKTELVDNFNSDYNNHRDHDFLSFGNYNHANQVFKPSFNRDIANGLAKLTNNSSYSFNSQDTFEISNSNGLIPTEFSNYKRPITGAQNRFIPPILDSSFHPNPPTVGDAKWNSNSSSWNATDQRIAFVPNASSSSSYNTRPTGQQQQHHQQQQNHAAYHQDYHRNHENQNMHNSGSRRIDINHSQHSHRSSIFHHPTSSRDVANSGPFFRDLKYNQVPSYHHLSNDSSNCRTGQQQQQQVQPTQSLNPLDTLKLSLDAPLMELLTSSTRKLNLNLPGINADFAANCKSSLPNMEMFTNNQSRGFVEEKFSRKVFVGGLPPDIDEEEITSAFRRFGQLTVDWPHKAESKSFFPPKGYCFLLFEEEIAVQNLIESCILDDGKYYWCVSSPTLKDKMVQIRPWCLSDSDYVMDDSQPLDPRRTIFVGGVPRPLRSFELAYIMNQLYGGVCYAGIDTDPELKYPKGAGRVAFSNQQSYIAAISARFVQLQHKDIDKRVEVKPYVLDDQVCDECGGMRSGGKFAPFFCANVACLQYYCEHCWAMIHALQGREYHKPLVKEGSERPRIIPFRW